MGLLKYLTIAGLSSLLSSCAPLTPDEQQKADERMLMLSLGYGSIFEPNPQKAAVMGLTSEIMRDYDVAREGKSEVIVNVQPTNPVQEYEDPKLSEEKRLGNNDRLFKKYGIGPYAVDQDRKNKMRLERSLNESFPRSDSMKVGNKNIIFDPNIGYFVICTCNEWIDENGDYVVNVDRPEDLEDFSSEIVGRKNKFSNDEKITVIFGAHIQHLKGLSYRLYDEKGKIIDQVKNDNYGINREYSVGSLKSGKYTAELYSPYKSYERVKGDGNRYAQLKFEVVNNEVVKKE
ncbi:MAG: hypothetical protein Q7S27_02450 [Nanoarchaeota archaeon]|nr:hypothetical protein [Nanoarchaeota archaeon]